LHNNGLSDDNLVRYY